MKNVALIIPAFNEQESIAKVLTDCLNYFDMIIVVNNNSTDQTEFIAKKFPVTVLFEPRRTYGQAVYTGSIHALSQGADYLAYIDADSSESSADLYKLYQHMKIKKLDLITGQRQSSQIPAHAHLGNRLACFIMNVVWNSPFRDLGPMRILSKAAWDKIQMQDRDYGWTVEMQAKALIYNLNIAELTIKSNKRIGKSKISGTIKGTFLASFYILKTLLFLFLKHPRRINS